MSEDRERSQLGEIEPWLVDVARDLTRVVTDANHMGTAEFIAGTVVARVERTPNGIRASFWRLERTVDPSHGTGRP